MFQMPSIGLFEKSVSRIWVNTANGADRFAPKYNLIY